MTEKKYAYAKPKPLMKVFKSMGVEFRFNIRRNCGEVLFDAAKWPEEARDWQPVTKRITHFLIEEIRLNWYNAATKNKESKRRLELTPTSFNACVQYIYKGSEVDPFRGYVESCGEWDGKSRIDDWMKQAGMSFGSDCDSRLLEWAQRYILLGSVARTYRPGLKLDVSPVLSSTRGGLGKSMILRLLFDPCEAHDVFFTDSLIFSNDQKRMLEAILGRVVVEMAEMAGVLRIDSDGLKSYLSRQNDNGIRLAWREDPEHMPRRCIFVGTCDTGTPLPDDPNLRRFVVMPIVDSDVKGIIEWMNANRRQLWAEAKHRWDAGESPVFPDELAAARDEINDQYRVSSPLEGRVRAWLDENAGDRGFNLYDVAYGIELIRKDESLSKLPNGGKKELTNVLRRLGYMNWRVSKHVDPRRPRMWMSLERIEEMKVLATEMCAERIAN